MVSICDICKRLLVTDGSGWYDPCFHGRHGNTVDNQTNHCKEPWYFT